MNLQLAISDIVYMVLRVVDQIGVFCILCTHVSLCRRCLTWALTSGAHVYILRGSTPKFLTIHAHAHLVPFSSCSS
jgi:hypothetical protein